MSSLEVKAIIQGGGIHLRAGEALVFAKPKLAKCFFAESAEISVCLRSGEKARRSMCRRSVLGACPETLPANKTNVPACVKSDTRSMVLLWVGRLLRSPVLREHRKAAKAGVPQRLAWSGTIGGEGFHSQAQRSDRSTMP